MSGLIPRGHAERENWFRQLAHVVHLGRCTRFPFGDCNRHEESEYFTPKDNDIASVVIRWLEFDQDVRCTIRTAAELDALPADAVVLTLASRITHQKARAFGAWYSSTLATSETADIGLPARLLWSPEWSEK